MSRLRVVYVQRRPARTSASKRRVLEVVRALLEEGVFHATTVEEVAARAGVSRATLYQHFGSRLGLLDSICDTIGQNPELQALRETDDLDGFVARTVEFWASEEKLLVQLYGAAAVDPAAHAFVERQRLDRYVELRRLLRVLGVPGEEAFGRLAVLTSFETYRELRRHAGRSKRDVVAVLQAAARSLPEA
jgi:AcrR family transcriptional regulator